MKIFYMGLEPLVERYSYQLQEWNTQTFERMGVDYHVVKGVEVAQQITVGSVLDAYGRSLYSMSQLAELLKLVQAGAVTENDVIFFEDMFTPGIESLPYLFDQLGWYPRIYARCLAQTIDPDDFVHRTGMFKWMRSYERIVDELCLRSGGGILVASEEMVPFLKVAEFQAPIYVTGLPFGKEEVLTRATPLPWADRPKLVSYAARWDSEKQPRFFLKVAKKVMARLPGTQFQVLTGSKSVRSDDPALLDALHSSQVVVRAGLSKNEYYKELARSRVLFNCALQDWVSNTVSEADAMGCMTIYPAYRSFPEVFASNPDHLYTPWSVESAVDKIVQVLLLDKPLASIGKVSDYQGNTVARTIRVFQGDQTARRDSLDYRKHVAAPKF